MKDRFTRVLKGMIDVSRIRFPKGTCGSQIDALARQSLVGRLAWITTMELAMASVPISQCTKALPALTNPTARHWNPA